MQKAKLIERLAELFAERKLPFLADIRDESTAEVRIVLKPRGRPVHGDVIMIELFRLTDLEVRIGVNMNVLVDGTTPRVLDLKKLLGAWLAHRREVLRRRSLHRRARIEQRLELLAGFLIVHLNLDEVIRIIREEDGPKQALMHRFALTETQADAVLNMRLRQLRKLEEFELRRERDSLPHRARRRRRTARQRGPDMATHRRGDQADRRAVRPEDRSRAQAHTDFGGAGRSRRAGSRASAGAADHRTLLREGLAARRARPSRRSLRRYVTRRGTSAASSCTRYPPTAY